MREYVIENEFVKAVHKAGGMAYKLNSLTANGLPDRLVLFFPAKTVFVELKAPGKQMRPLQVKRRKQLNALGFPVICIDRFDQITPAITAILTWTPGEPFPDGIGAEIPDLESVELPGVELPEDAPDELSPFFEPEDESVLAMFEDTEGFEGHTSQVGRGCICDDCETGREHKCGHAFGRHYDVWGEGLGTPDYCPQKPDPDDPNALLW